MTNINETDIRAAEAAGDGAQPETVTLCGSMTIFARILAEAAELTDAGAVVLAPFRVVAQPDQGTEAKAALDALHRWKIRMADRVVVVTDEVGRLGESTSAEVEFARALGRPVEFRARRAVTAR